MNTTQENLEPAEVPPPAPPDTETHDATSGSVQANAALDPNPHTNVPGDNAIGGANDARGLPAHPAPVDQGFIAASAPLTDRREASAHSAKIQTGMVSVTRLRPYAKNAEIYEDREDPLFTDNIRKNGVLTDLVVTEDGEVLGGNRRLREATRLGLLEVPVKVVICKTEDEKMLRVLDDNVQRVKSKVEIIHEYVERLKVETRAAALRKVEAGRKAKGHPGEVKTLTPPAGKKGKARDIAAKTLDLSGVSAEQGRKAFEAMAKARAQGAYEVADELLMLINEKGFHAGFKRAGVLKLIAPVPKKATKKKTVAKPKPAVAAAPDANNVASQPRSGDAGEAGAPKPAAPVTSSGTYNAFAETEKEEGEVPTQQEGAAAMVIEVLATEEAPESVELVITHCDKAVDALEFVEIERLTRDQKGNLHRALESVVEWFEANESELEDLALR